MLLHLIILIVGIVLLIKGADWLINGSSSLAKKYGVSDLVIGLTIVSFGTSAPEMVVNIFASYFNNDSIVFGNIIGSNNFNLFFILGLSGIIAPITIKSTTIWREIPLSLFVTIIFLFFTNGYFSNTKYLLQRGEGLVLLLIFGLYLYYIFILLKKDSTQIKLVTKEYSNIKIWISILGGLVLLVVGGQLVVTNGVKLALLMGISEKIIGLTIIAVGTSAPELATSVVAVLKKNNDIAVGNIIGSNIFNLLFILSISSIINPLSYSVSFNTDFYLLIGGTIFLFVAMFTGEKRKLDRWEAGLLFITYLSVITYYVFNEIK